MYPNLEVKVNLPVYWASGGSVEDLHLFADSVVRDLLKVGSERIEDLLQGKDQGPMGVYYSIEEAAAAGSTYTTGRYRKSVYHEMTGFAHAAIYDSGETVYGPWLEGISSRSYSGRFQGYFMFRKTRDYIESMVPEVAEANIGRFQK